MLIDSQHPAVAGIKTVKKGIALNLFLVMFKGLAGVLGNSYALVADALESATDVLASLLVWIGLKTAAKPPDHDHPYGHGKAEPMVAGVVSILLFATATFIVYHSIANIQTPHESPAAWTLLVLLTIIVGKEWAYQLAIRTGQDIDSQALRAEAQHHRADALSSIAAFIGIAIAKLGGDGYESADDWAALLAAGFIYWNGAKILYSSLLELMDTALPTHEVEDLKSIAEAVEGVRKVEACFVRKTGFEWFVDITLQVDGNLTVSEGHAIAHGVADAIQIAKTQVYAVHTHVEPFQ
jgi:cation diffusion facilitator family transporter